MSAAAPDGDARADLWRLVAQDVPASLADLAVQLGRRLLLRAPATVAALSDATLAALIASAARFVAGGGPLPRVRVFTAIPDRDGWASAGSVLEVLQQDRPFIVETVGSLLAEAGLAPHALLHPLLDVARTADGSAAPAGGAGDSRRESFLHVALPALEPAAAAALAARVSERLAVLHVVTDDFGAMLARAQAIADELGREPAGPTGADPHAAAAWLRWLAEGHFVFLGHREYAVEGAGDAATLRVRPGTGLGILRRDARSAFATPRRLAALAPAVRAGFASGTPVVVDRTHAVAPVPRAAHMLDVRVQGRDAAGRVVQVRRFLGLLTSRGEATEPADVPLLREALQALLATEHAEPGSHDGRALVRAFNDVPTTALLASTPEERRADVLLLVGSARTARVVVSVAPRAGGRRLRVLVVMPPDHASAEAASRVAALVTARVGGVVLDQHFVVREAEPGRLHLLVAPAETPVPDAARAALEREIAATFGSWADAVRAALLAGGSPDGGRLAARWADAFPADYRATTDAARAAADVRGLDAAATSGVPHVALEAGAPSLLRIYRPGAPLVLADALPVLEHLGVRVLGEDRIEVAPAGASVVWLHRLQVHDRADRPLDPAAVEPRLTEALRAVWRGEACDDPLNRLVVDAGLDWRQVDVLRAYAGWAVQAGSGTWSEIVATLSEHPAPAARLYAVFAARFGDAPADPDPRAAFLQSLEDVPSLRQDQVLRDLLAAVDATVRTNAFAQDRSGAALALKIRSGDVPRLPAPRPRFEIWVHAPAVVGIHLRAGAVARGGIRLSDRPQDFRTEVLGLVKTQTVKNAVIVPTGAKGAFVPAPGVAPLVAYRTYVHALLDLTDDVHEGVVVRPAGARVLDGDDPYLVVAADKGTATFSDAANAIATARGFWLGDAFASGGSHGYDHKALGITARGAWESVRTHARTLGLDADTAPLDVVGIGDMSGDVFGNGLLRSPHLRLRAAFDHRHVFLDPDPDPARSVAERRRCFAERLGWDGYDRAALSPGGMIVSRSAKAVELTPAVRAMLGCSEPAPSGEALVRAVLAMPADVLWNGGIGTYVRAAHETDAMVGDPANDRVRVAADALRVRIVAEGGNLGLTQAARVAFALRGGLVNTDAIDNSAGVDCSDHEVNLKICLQPLVAAGRLDLDARNALLADVTDDVVARVLDHNRRQTRLLGVEQVRSRTRLSAFVDLMGDLAADGQLDRALEGLPDREALRARRSAYVGLARPELAVLVAHAKIALQTALHEAALLDDPLLEPWLLDYFPPRVVEAWPDAVRGHRLRREIVATEVANALVDGVGATFVSRLRRDTGVDVAGAVRAWAVAWRLVDGAALGRAIDAEAATTDGEVACRCALEAATARAARWVVAHADPARDAGTVADALVAAIAPVRASLPAWLAGPEAEAFAQRRDALAAAGLADATATALATAEWTAGALDVVAAARRGGLAVADAGRRYFALASAVDFAWILARLADAASDDRWERDAVAGLVEDVHAARRRLVAVPPDALPARPLGRVQAALHDLRAAPRAPLAALLVLVRELRRLADSASDPLARREQDAAW